MQYSVPWGLGQKCPKKNVQLKIGFFWSPSEPSTNDVKFCEKIGSFLKNNSKTVLLNPKTDVYLD